MKLFLDANVLFTAAHNPDGKAALIIDLGHAAGWLIATSTYARAEAIRNLERKAPGAVARMDTISASLKVVDHRPELPYPTDLVPKDRPIFQAALGWEASHLLTDDLQHFGPIMNQPENTFGIIVQTVAVFLRSVAK